MQVRNVHERVLHAPGPRVAALLDSLASAEDQLWPRDQWPAMRFDRPLRVGGVGGHGPIRYVVEAYEPGRSVRFRFTGPRDFLGAHGYEIQPVSSGGLCLRHVLSMQAVGPARLSWPLVFRPLHDALIEDSLDRAARSLGIESERSRWSAWVRALRWLLNAFRRRHGRGP
jgi:hypothetical protein